MSTYELPYVERVGNGALSCLPVEKGGTGTAATWTGDAYCRTLTA